jgi:phospholipid-transporting ATPase
LEDEFQKSGAINFFSLFGTWFLILSNMVPISLLVTIEVIKYVQGLFINNDINMYDKTQDRRTTVQASSLNEELGQINAIFSDKTGTLTCNEMNFKKICILGKNYGIDNPQSAENEYKLHMSNVDFADKNLEELL